MHEAVGIPQVNHRYNMAGGHKMRIMLLSLSPGEHFFVAVLHPLVAACMSFQNLLKDFPAFIATQALGNHRNP